MRLVIAATSFIVPLMLVVAIGSCFADVPGAGTGSRPAMPPARMDELRRFIQGNAGLLDHYAAGSDTIPGSGVPHLGLDRFATRGRDADGHPWYRLAEPPGRGRAGGVLRRAANDHRQIERIDGSRLLALSPLVEHWWYWEGEPEAGTTAKSP